MCNKILLRKVFSIMIATINVPKGSFNLNSNKIRADISNNIAYVMPITAKENCANTSTEFNNHVVGRVRNIDTAKGKINIDFVDGFDMSLYTNIGVVYDASNKSHTIFYIFEKGNK